MNSPRTEPPSPAGMTLGDIYYVLFRHKWKILIPAMAGLALAASIFFLDPPPYESQAELLIKYVPEATALKVGDNQRVVLPDARGDSIISSEIQILSSLDLAELAVTNLGAETVLAGAGGGANPGRAAFLIRNNLLAEPASKGSSVIVVTLKHPNPQNVQAILQEIVTAYLQKHYEIHSAGGQFDDALSREQLTLGEQLNDTEQQLAALKSKANIVSLDDSRKGLADQINRIQGSVLDAQATLSGLEAAQQQQQAQPQARANTGATNAAAPAPQDQIDAYHSLSSRLDLLRKKEQGYQVQGFTSSNSLLKEVEAQITEVQKNRADMEKLHPELAATAAAPAALANTGEKAISDERDTAAQIAAMQAKIKILSGQLDLLQSAATNLNSVTPTIEKLEQARDIQRANYQNLSLSLERSHIDQALDSGKSPNIKWVQMPTPPAQDWKKTKKLQAIVAFGGLALGLAWAFLLELYVDRSIKRPREVEADLKIPLFLSIPNVNRNGHARQLKAASLRQLGNGSAPNGQSPAVNGHSGSAGNAAGKEAWELIPFNRNPLLDPYYEALRDRLISYFEIKGLTHKPKLVGLTSVSSRAGVSTVAAGLAASFSKTGDGHVLLVDMHLENGAAQRFYRGHPICGLDAALEKETKENALVSENLYVVVENSNAENLPRVLPRRFAGLLPKLKASNFDYIIFDLPVVSQTSVTTRVARFMDMLLLVIESEETDRDVVRRTREQLVEHGGNVGAVLNKTHRYVPKRLHLDYPGED